MAQDALALAHVHHEAVAHQPVVLRRHRQNLRPLRHQEVGFRGCPGDPPHHAAAERDLPFAARALVHAGQEAAGQPQGFLQGRLVAVGGRRRLQDVLEPSQRGSGWVRNLRDGSACVRGKKRAHAQHEGRLGHSVQRPVQKSCTKRSKRVELQREPGFKESRASKGAELQRELISPHLSST